MANAEKIVSICHMLCVFIAHALLICHVLVYVTLPRASLQSMAQLDEISRVQGKIWGGAWHAHLIPSGARGSFRYYETAGEPTFSLYSYNAQCKAYF